jgi:hypothetical protein
MHHAGDDQDDAAAITDVLTVLKRFEDFLFTTLFVAPNDIGVSLQTLQSISSFRKRRYLFSAQVRISHDKGVWRQGWRQSNGQGWRKVALVMGDPNPC